MPIVTIGGLQANVTFSGLAPGYVGLYQVNAQVPAGVAVGTAVPVTISMGGQVSNTVTIPVSNLSTMPLNVLPALTNSFTPGSSTLQGLPQVANSAGAAVNSVGYQDGAYVIPVSGSGTPLPPKVIYYPWQVQDGGTTWVEAIQDGI